MGNTGTPAGDEAPHTALLATLPVDEAALQAVSIPDASLLSRLEKTYRPAQAPQCPECGGCLVNDPSDSAHLICSPWASSATTGLRMRKPGRHEGDAHSQASRRPVQQRGGDHLVMELVRRYRLISPDFPENTAQEDAPDAC